MSRRHASWTHLHVIQDPEGLVPLAELRPGDHDETVTLLRDSRPKLISKADKLFEALRSVQTRQDKMDARSVWLRDLVQEMHRTSEVSAVDQRMERHEVIAVAVRRLRLGAR